MSDEDDEVPFICPFCGRQCYAQEDTYAVLHTVPTCAVFDASEPDVFLHKVNRAYGNVRRRDELPS